MGARLVGGMTLLEMLVVMLIVALLGAIGVPVMARWLQQSSIGAGSLEFRQMLVAGRYLALAENDYVTLCPVDEADGNCGRTWGRRAMMFVDVNGNGRQDPADRLLHGNFVLPDGTWLVWRAFRQLPYLQWAPFGRTNSLNGTFTLCNREQRGEWIRQWIISKAGRVREVLPARAGGAGLQAALQLCL